MASFEVGVGLALLLEDVLKVVVLVDVGLGLLLDDGIVAIVLLVVIEGKVLAPVKLASADGSLGSVALSLYSRSGIQPRTAASWSASAKSMAMRL